MVDKRKVGRPKKSDIKTYFTGTRLTEQEINELKEFSALNHNSVSDFIRDAIGMKIDGIRAKYGLRKPDECDFYDDYEVHDDENNDYLDDDIW